ncbi:hypothetical protein NE172_18145 [Clostridium botulinum]|uniref:Uncharacterized protein n=1 Tax=Clostridium botulinum TaxID=1491 RepID=A0A6B4JRQ5_CLOBO|nr:DUF6751 family protein [Clostridium botulinum]EES49930.1 hypothetical protein CLO_1569 [Clostridium botulinum E1 str. 'BoNT E Beluga']MBY6762838.1 hypothetical protein [Clostridium botulinum]MBY6921622.1 hypothetical protein [Clostridium botulinum]MCR1132824.1 hypothetical protein [Clostridium botulinum]NFJ59648.1 hypothetical protein [Clostridium botulinum]
MVLFPNSDITIYHLDKKTQTYSRINLEDVNWSGKRTATVSDKGVNVAYTVIISAEIGDYKVYTGDKIIRGNITLDITKISDLSAYEVVTVIGTQECDIFHSLSIECK